MYRSGTLPSGHRQTDADIPLYGGKNLGITRGVMVMTVRLISGAELTDRSIVDDGATT